MKRILFISALLVSFLSEAQVKQKLGTYGVVARRIKVDSAFQIPTFQVGIKDAYAGFDTAQLMYKPVDSSVYVHTGSQWQRLARAAEIATPYTVSNGLTLASSNIKLGGTLVNNTVINSRGFSFRIDSSTLQNYSTYRATDTSTAFISMRSTGSLRFQLGYEDALNTTFGSVAAGLQIFTAGDGADLVIYNGNSVTPQSIITSESEFNSIIFEADSMWAPNLTNDTRQDKLIGWYSGSSGHIGRMGYLSAGSNITISGGTISASGGGFSVTNESNNRVITSVSAGVGNAEANMTFDGSVLTVTGQIQQGGTAGITNGYLRTNSTNLASTTDLNPGVALYGGGAGVAVYGFDLGYNATSARYRNRMFMFGTSADIAFSATNDTPPTAQSGFTDLVVIRGDSGNMGIGVIAPTGVLHLKAGTVAANTAPIKFTSGTILGTIEAGAKEYNNAHYETTAALNRLATGGAIKDFLITADNSGTGETDLFTYTTKASTLAADGEKLNFNIGGSFNDLTATAQLQFYFGGTSIGNTGALTVSATGGWSANIFIIRTSSTTVRALVAVTTPGASTAVYTTQTDLTGLTLSATNIIKVTGTAAGASGGSGDISAKLGTIFWYGAVSN